MGGCKWGSLKDPCGDGNILDLVWIGVRVLAGKLLYSFARLGGNEEKVYGEFCILHIVSYECISIYSYLRIKSFI